MRIVIIGATGHIGTWLVPRLVRAGHEVVAMTRGIRRPYHDALEWASVERVAVDRTAEEQAGTFGRRLLALAADVVVDLVCFDVASCAALVNALRGRVQHLVHCGTLWVHGVPPVRPYDETAPRTPFGDYGIKKAAVERYLLEEAAAGLPATVLHPGHISGPGWAPINPAGHLNTSVFDALSRGDTLVLPDDGLATLQHVHADDVAQAFERAIANPELAIGESFHVAASEPVTLRAYAEAAARWFGREARLAFLPWTQWRVTVSEREAALTWDHVRHSPCASIGKIQRALGFAPRFSAVEAARDAVAALYTAIT
jgi:nucleoside-diphosphate-sugar epimerase